MSDDRFGEPYSNVRTGRELIVVDAPKKSSRTSAGLIFGTLVAGGFVYAVATDRVNIGIFGNLFKHQSAVVSVPVNQGSLSSTASQAAAKEKELAEKQKEFEAKQKELEAQEQLAANRKLASAAREIHSKNPDAEGPITVTVDPLTASRLSESIQGLMRPSQSAATIDMRINGRTEENNGMRRTICEKLDVFGDERFCTTVPFTGFDKRVIAELNKRPEFSLRNGFVATMVRDSDLSVQQKVDYAPRSEFGRLYGAQNYINGMAFIEAPIKRVEKTKDDQVCVILVDRPDTQGYCVSASKVGLDN